MARKLSLKQLRYLFATKFRDDNNKNLGIGGKVALAAGGVGLAAVAYKVGRRLRGARLGKLAVRNARVGSVSGTSAYKKSLLEFFHSKASIKNSRLRTLFLGKNAFELEKDMSKATVEIGYATNDAGTIVNVSTLNNPAYFGLGLESDTFLTHIYELKPEAISRGMKNFFKSGATRVFHNHSVVGGTGAWPYVPEGYGGGTLSLLDIKSFAFGHHPDPATLSFLKLSRNNVSTSIMEMRAADSNYKYSLRIKSFVDGSKSKTANTLLTFHDTNVHKVMGNDSKLLDGIYVRTDIVDTKPNHVFRALTPKEFSDIMNERHRLLKLFNSGNFKKNFEYTVIDMRTGKNVTKKVELDYKL
jgi:hypothetical protein